MGNRVIASSLWRQLKVRKPSPEEIIPILQRRECGVRNEAWLYFRTSQPSVQALIKVIKTAPDYIDEAWKLLISDRQNLTEETIVLVIESARSLQSKAWAELAFSTLSWDQLVRVLKVSPSLRELAFAKLLHLNPHPETLRTLKEEIPVLAELIDSVLNRSTNDILSDLLDNL